MLRTFHITSGNTMRTQSAQENTEQLTDNQQLNVSECNNGRKVLLGIDSGNNYAEIALNYQQFSELCDLRYTLDLSADEPEQQVSVESNQLALKVA